MSKWDTLGKYSDLLNKASKKHGTDSRGFIQFPPGCPIRKEIEELEWQLNAAGIDPSNPTSM